MMTSPVFKVSPQKLAGVLIKMWIKRNWWWLALPAVIALIMAAAVDLRFVFVALIIIFVVIPPVMITVYFYHALAPEARMTVLSHSLSADRNGITVTYESPDPEIPSRDPDMIRWTDVTGITSDRSFMIFHLSGSRYKIFLMPWNVWDDRNDSAKWSEICRYFIKTR